ncbi:hypothetical protein DCCM_0734 [Desulfocucumis palustris]|uniref:Uncharacterized protein n=1 Tax=Desulfocucumis palustris TaxID=1898651 RepID=A0A2L2X8U7_9FIRM|nr:hypothetical protein DCCM_0734 [Desulfocucumis palustris]
MKNRADFYGYCILNIMLSLFFFQSEFLAHKVAAVVLFLFTMVMLIWTPRKKNDNDNGNGKSNK